MARPEEYVEEVRALNKQAWEGILGLLKLQEEWNALDYANTLPTVSGFTSAQVGAVVFAAAGALKTTLDSGIATNMAALL